MNIKLDKSYEVKTTLGTVRDIENIFNKSFFDVISGITAMKIEEQIKLLYIGVKRANDITEEAFAELCDNYVGIGDLMEYLEQYIFAMQFSGLSEQEVQEKLGKKLQRNSQLQTQPR
ncbi:MAG: hypothetical protein LBU60_06230 [Clostridiales bacterium]|jgi:hypothetical protein|nr:hypothetical protein [Clostridiales bacterium]